MMPARLYRLAVTLLIAAATAASPCLAQTWSFVDDWSTQQGNPNGAWSYGWWTADMSGFQLYTSPGGNPTTIDAWGTSQNESVLAKNSGPATVNVQTQWLEHNQGLMHPGQYNAKAAARWTSPITGLVSVTAHFSGQSFGGAEPYPTTTDVHVLKSGSPVFDGFIKGFAGRAANGYSDAFGPSPNQRFSTVISVVPGDTVDFVCGYGQNGTYSYDITGLDATIEAIPFGPRVCTDSIAEAKTYADGTVVEMTSAKSVTAAAGTFTDGSTYVEEPDRCAGIRAVPGSGLPSVSEGDLIRFEGVMATKSGGGRVIHLTSITPDSAGSELKPLGMSSRALKPGLQPDATGLLVRAVGTVRWKSPDGSYVRISDGGKGEARVILSGQTRPVRKGCFVRQTIAVTGLAGLANDGGKIVRTIRPRGGEDVDLLSSPTDDQAIAQTWVESYLGQTATSRPFSFVYGGQQSPALLGSWQKSYATRAIDQNKTERTITYTDPASGLKVECIAVEYGDFPTVEWTLYFTNTGTADTPIIEQIKTLDTRFTHGDTGEFLLHYMTGDNAAKDSYAPHLDAMTPGKSLHLNSSGGRPTTGGFPYFNIEQPSGGVIAVVSWGGQWSADFARDSSDGLRVSAGQELTYFRLHPGERVQAPMAVLQFYNGDWIEAQNTWRRWMLKHNLPRPNGDLQPPMLIMCEGLWSNWNAQKALIDKYTAESIPVTHWWQDAGWYACPENSWWVVGTWEPDYTRYPGGLKQMSDYVHERGMKLITWFEPERVASDTWLALNHPEWIYGGSGGGLLKLGDPACRAWLTEHIDGLLVSQGIDLYRQDFNIDPLGYWKGNDASDRQGMTEINHVMSYYAYWDELHRRHPSMVIDSCASGGRRNNLETLRRALPLLRSDYQFEPIGQQCHTWALSMWIPFYGTGVGPESAYVVRSSFAPSFGIGTGVASPPETWANMRRWIGQWQQVNELMFADFYPLTAFSLANDVWIGWQYNDPEQGKGYIQAFRRASCPSTSTKVYLRGLDRGSVYTVTDLDTAGQVSTTGTDLMENGLTLSLGSAPADVVVVYEKAAQ